MQQFKTIQVRRPQIGMRVRLKNCHGGYFLPPEIPDGQKAIVVGFENCSIVVRVKGGARYTLPSPTVDAGMDYQLPDGRWIDETDRRVQKMRARSQAHLEWTEMRRHSIPPDVPF